jgi:hypothetical protein
MNMLRIGTIYHQSCLPTHSNDVACRLNLRMLRGFPQPYLQKSIAASWKSPIILTDHDAFLIFFIILIEFLLAGKVSFVICAACILQCVN